MLSVRVSSFVVRWLPLALLGLQGSCVGPEGTDDLDEPELATATQAAMTCSSTVTTSGTTGTANVASFVTALISNSSGDTLNISAPGFGDTAAFHFGNGITSTGAFGNTTQHVEINQLNTAFGGTTLAVSGTVNGVRDTRNITLTGGRFGFSARAFGHLTKVAGTGRQLVFTGTSLDGASTGTGNVDVYSSTCTLTPSFNGSAGTITLSANAPGATQVKYYVDSVLVGTGASASPFNFSFDSRLVVNGTHSLVAIATDGTTNGQAMSAPVSFTTNNPLPTITPAVGGSTGTFALSATVSQPVQSVQFFVDGLSKGSDTTSPYSINFDSRTIANGSHTLVAKFSIAGVATASLPFTFTTDNDLTPPAILSTQSVTSLSGVFGANVVDAVGSIHHVDLAVGAFPLVTRNAAPYTVTYDTRFIGNNPNTNFTVTAVDQVGNTSKVVKVLNINNGTAVDTDNSTLGNPVQVSNTTVKASGRIGSSDEDFFRLSLPAGKTLQLHMECSALTCGIVTNYNLYVVTTSGSVLAASEGPTNSELLSYANTSGAEMTVVIKVTSASGTGQGYTITIDRP